MAVVDPTRTVDGGKYEPTLNSSKMKKRALLLVLLINSGTQRRKFARCSLCFIHSAGMLVGTQNTACVPFVAVTGGVFTLFFFVCVGHHLNDDPHSKSESFDECLTLGQIVHFG